MDPMPVPVSPPPGSSVPDIFEDVQFRTLPVVVSVSVVLPAFALMVPPGLTVQVFAAAATSDPALRATARAAAPARTAAPKAARMAIASLWPCTPSQRRPAQGARCLPGLAAASGSQAGA